jgi:alpha-pyrone synthase
MDEELSLTQPCINRIASAVPDYEVNAAFAAMAGGMVKDGRLMPIYRRMAQRTGIRQRYSVLDPSLGDGRSIRSSEFYDSAYFPRTGDRMKLFEQLAPGLARRALDALALTAEERSGIGHVIVTCCTGLYAPGLDFEVVDYLGLDTAVERTVIGFMGCYAAINGLKQARHIVRSEPEAKVLLLNLELCSLHMQETEDFEHILSFLVFGDGCTASLISAEATGLAMDSFRSLVIPDTRELITWKIGDFGFDMLLSGEVPLALGKALATGREQVAGSRPVEDIQLWAVHPGGKSILDAVERGLGIAPDKMVASRHVLEQYGNMSSASVMFVLERLMREAKAGEQGCALSFGPGLTAETMLFHAV